MKILNFWSCDLEKSADSAFLAQKGLLSETIRARAKWTKYCDDQSNQTYLTENFHFWSCDPM